MDVRPSDISESVEKEQKRVILVDPEEGIRSVFSTALKLAGYGVETYGKAAEALARVKWAEQQKGYFSCLVVEGSHGIDGCRLAANIGEIEPDLPIILTSSYPRHLEGTVPGNVSEVLRKPFDAPTLMKTMEKYIS